MVYFIRDGEFIKIGVTNNMKSRLSQIRTSNPRELEIIKIIDGDAFLEAMIHKYFSKYRHRNEWFHLEGELYEYLYEGKQIIFIEEIPKPSNKPKLITDVYPRMNELTIKYIDVIGERYKSRHIIKKIYEDGHTYFLAFVRIGQSYYCIYKNRTSKKCIEVCDKFHKDMQNGKYIISLQ